MARETLTREKIVQAAIELLDEEGLEGLSMRALGERLGSAATAVYWHVESKDNLVVLASDTLWNEIGLPDLGTVDWRTAGMSMAKDQYAMLTRHPWLVQAMGSQVLYGPGKARHDDHNLAVYEMGGFVGAEADQAVSIVFMYVLGNAFGASASASLRMQLRRHGGDAEARIRELVAKQTEIAAQFPRLYARMGSVDQSDYYAAPEKSLEFGLEAIFDGLERQLSSGRRAAGPESHVRGWFA
jgi:AcrR family transcriptional regulator